MSHLGAIADDFTGATDLATNLAKRGFQVIVVPEEGISSLDTDFSRFEAVVVALKTRTAPLATAVSDSLRALEFLQELGCSRFYYKYCSTFDSTDEGNIGPVLDALCLRLHVERAVVVPSFPDNGRTLVGGVLYVDGDLLEHSSMRTHPLTPMTRSRVSEILQPQTPYSVTEVHGQSVSAGEDELRLILESVTGRYVVVDAVTNADLRVIARATSDDILVSGGSGLALGLDARGNTTAPGMVVTNGRRLVLSGSASSATRGQVAHAIANLPALRVDIKRLLDDPEATLLASMDFLASQDHESAVVVYAAESLDDVAASRALAVEGVDPAERVEWLLAHIAVEAVRPEHGFTRIIVAGGETSGAVVKSLGLNSLVIGNEIAPGVCWAFGTTNAGVAVNLALKSGNFGTEDMFTAGWKKLEG